MAKRNQETDSNSNSETTKEVKMQAKGEYSCDKKMIKLEQKVEELTRKVSILEAVLKGRK